MPADTTVLDAPPLADITWLQGVRVVEVTTAVSAPLIGRVLAELGAEVVKVESRAKPDVNRVRLARPDDPEGYPVHEAFQLLHEASASKQSVTLNLKSEEGLALFLELLGDADVFIENFVPGWLDRLGIPVPELRKRFPRLIIMSASGYGQTGPLRTQRSYAPVMSALAGVEGLIGYEDGDVVGCSALALADLNCSFYGVFLVTAALRGREESGEGCHLDFSQIEAASTLAGEAFVSYGLEGTRPAPRGNAHADGTAWAMLPTDGGKGWVATVVEDASAWQNTEGMSRAELLARLAERGVEAAPVRTPDEVRTDPVSQQRGYTQTLPHPHPLVADLQITSVPWYLDGELPRVRGAAPMLGAANRHVLGRYRDAAVLAELEENGALR